MSERDLVDEEVVPETEEEAEARVEAATVGLETVAMGLTPLEMLPSDGGRIALQRLRRVPGVRRARFAQEGEYDPDEWPDEGEESPIFVDSGSGIWVLMVAAIGALIWLLWSHLDCRLITRAQFGTRFPDDDLITSDLRDGTTGFMTVTLRSERPVDWLKAIELRDVKNTVRMRMYTDGDRRQDRILVPNSELRQGVLVLWKAKFLGVHTAKYVLAGLHEFENKHLTLTWKKDAAWHW